MQSYIKSLNHIIGLVEDLTRDEYKYTNIDKLDTKSRIPVVQQRLTVPNPNSSAYTLNDPAPLSFKLVDSHVAASRILLRYADIQQIKDLPAFFRSALNEFAELSGFAEAQRQGEVFAVCAPTFLRPGRALNEFVRELSDPHPPDALEIRMYTDYVPNKKTSRKKQR